MSFQGLLRANEEFVAEVERLYGEEERWEGRLEDFLGKFRLGSVKGDFWDKSTLNNPEYKTSGCTAQASRRD